MKKMYFALGASILAVAPEAWAQRTESEDVVVTAQRRQERLVDVGASIAALSANELERTGVTNLAGLSQVVPGFRMDLAGANVQPSIRGVGSPIAGAGLSANVANYADGFYRPNGITNNAEFNDIQAIEVLKGPQGTLFGRNATGGALVITTLSPSFDPAARFRLSYGSYDDVRANVYLTGGMTDELAGSLSLFARDMDGYTENILTGRRQGDTSIRAARAKLLFEPTTDMSFELAAEYNHTDDNSVFTFPNWRGQASAALIPGAVVASGQGHVSTDFDPKFVSESHGVFFTAEFDLGWGALTSRTGYQTQENESQYDVDGSSERISHVYFPGAQDTFTQEIDIAIQRDRVDFVGGLFYMRDDARQTAFTVLSIDPPLDVLTAGVETESIAAFADLTYQLTPRLFLTGGVRYGVDNVEAHQIDIAGATGLHTNEAEFSAWTPRAVIRYKTTEDSSIYASFSQGTKAGGFNATGDISIRVRPEEIDAFEIGYKYAGDNWQFETAAFHYDYADLQYSSFAGASTQLINAASASVYGAEFHLAGRLTDELRLDFGLAYTHAEYDSFPDAPHQIWDPLTGVSVFPDDASGNTMIRAPELSGALNLTYSRPFESGILDLTSSLSYQSRVEHDPFGESYQPPVGVLNLRAAWSAPNDSWSVSLFGNNVTDEEYLTSVVLQSVGFQGAYAPPAVYGIELSLRR